MLRNDMPTGEPEVQGQWQARRMGDAWIPVPAAEAVWLVREGEVLLAGREYTLRLEPGSAWIDDPREPLKVRAAGGQGAVLWRLALPGSGLPAVLHDADSEFARVLATLAGSGAEPEAVADALRGALGDLPGRIERCTGRNPLRRRDQFIRLARARALLAWGEASRPTSRAWPKSRVCRARISCASSTASSTCRRTATASNAACSWPTA